MANPPMKRNGTPSPAQPLSEETIRDLLAVQKQELALRLKEVERDNAEINLNKDVAKQSIEAQERDRKHAREEHTKRQKTHQNFVLLAALGIIVFAGFALQGIRRSWLICPFGALHTFLLLRRKKMLTV